MFEIKIVSLQSWTWQRRDISLHGCFWPSMCRCCSFRRCTSTRLRMPASRCARSVCTTSATDISRSSQTGCTSACCVRYSPCLMWPLLPVRCCAIVADAKPSMPLVVRHPAWRRSVASAFVVLHLCEGTRREVSSYLTEVSEIKVEVKMAPPAPEAFAEEVNSLRSWKL